MNQIVCGRHNSELRFRLVEIVSDKRIECGGAGILDHPKIVAKQIVQFADAVLAAMEKKPEAKPSTEKDQRPTRTGDGGLLV